MRSEAPTLPAPLECAECGTVDHGLARGWRAYIGRGEEFDGVEIGIFCPACAEYEFGDSELDSAVTE
jgi:hypothetical protein